MSARPLSRRVARARAWLRSAALLKSLLRGVLASLSVLLLAALADALLDLPRLLRGTIAVLALAFGGAMFARALRRSGALRASTLSAALWIEGRFPTLRYALVTALDPVYAGHVGELESRAQAVPFEAELRRASWRALAMPTALVALSLAVVAALPDGAVARLIEPTPGDASRRASLFAVVNPLATISVRVVPPAYARRASSTADDPTTIQGLAGSTLVITGRSGLAAVTATLGTRAVPAAARARQWEIAVSMPAAPGILRFTAGRHERLVALRPVVDSAPAVTLTLPARDSIVRFARGVMRLAASLADDIALSDARFEFVVSSGAGETFIFSQGSISAAVLRDRSAAIVATLSLDSLKLQPGDVVHVRAVARDGNTVSGPGVGTSETRALRVARAGEYDSLAVDAAPPAEPEKDVLSQRMLLMLATALERRRPAISRATVLAESRGIAADQTRLRRRVGEIVFARLGETRGEEGDAADRRLDRLVNADSLLAAADRATTVASGAALERSEDESPLVAVNRPLLEAYNHMWSAGTELELGQPGRAIPFMQKALDALQSARAAERIYLRGRSRSVVVDVERVRLAGKDKAAPGTRTPRPADDPARRTRLARFDRATAMVGGDAGAAADSLLLLSVALATVDTAAQRALEIAAHAVRRGGDVTETLVRVRRILAGSTPRPSALGPWGTPW